MKRSLVGTCAICPNSVNRSPACCLTDPSSLSVCLGREGRKWRRVAWHSSSDSLGATQAAG
ncbi:hypothetical protein BX600DRAFT_445965 [Xylariales sp. PMI_506]|nr:hypothetical protein BX600DRAFT_445965 [Xylariales sp. PMI_506]